MNAQLKNQVNNDARPGLRDASRKVITNREQSKPFFVITNWPATQENTDTKVCLERHKQTGWMQADSGEGVSECGKDEGNEGLITVYFKIQEDRH